MIASKDFVKDIISKVIKSLYIPLKNDLYFKKGEVYNAYTITHGFISNSGKDLYITTSLPKSMKNISSITVNTVTGDMRAKSKYIGATAATGTVNFLSGASTAAYKIDNYNVRITMAKSSAYTNGSTVNNSAISFIGTLKLTFK